MKKKVSELTGVELDYAVAIAENLEVKEFDRQNEFVMIHGISGVMGNYIYDPTTNWQQCGEILEREQISLNMTRGIITRQPRYWTAISDNEEHYADDDDPKVAICKCFVRAKLGEVVEIPE